MFYILELRYLYILCAHYTHDQIDQFYVRDCISLTTNTEKLKPYVSTQEEDCNRKSSCLKKECVSPPSAINLGDVMKCIKLSSGEKLGINN